MLIVATPFLPDPDTVLSTRMSVKSAASVRLEIVRVICVTLVKCSRTTMRLPWRVTPSSEAPSLMFRMIACRSWLDRKE